MSDLKTEIMYIYNNNKYKIEYSKSVGVDGINGKNFTANDNEINIIKRKIDGKCYKFSNYKEKLIIKKQDNTRQISISTQRDKLVLKGLLKVLQKYFPINNTSAINNIIDIKNKRNQYDSFIKIDIIKFFPSINHKKLLPLIKAKTNDEIYNLVKLATTQPTASIEKPKNDRSVIINHKGIPQGLPISSFLADIFLEAIDKKYKKNIKIEYYRFVDDILILCNANDVECLINSIKKDLDNLDLKTHEQNDDKDKSSNGSIKNGFQYLGYNFTDNLVSVRQSSVQKLYNNINKLFTTYKYKKADNKNKDDKSELIECFYCLNKKIVGVKHNNKKYGWINYFSEINDKTLLFKIDNYVKNTLNKYLSKSDLKYLKNNNLKVKRISKAIFEIKKEASNYTECYENHISMLFKELYNTKIKENDFKNPEKIIKSLESDIEIY
jgi:retron-type reverse transcriptase